MKTRHKRLATTVSALVIALFALASAPTGAVGASSAPICQYVSGCVASCGGSVCSILGCKTKCLKMDCDDGGDAFVCKH
jgi:hypothetical protein